MFEVGMNDLRRGREFLCQFSQDKCQPSGRHIVECVAFVNEIAHCTSKSKKGKIPTQPD